MHVIERIGSLDSRVISLLFSMLDTLIIGEGYEAKLLSGGFGVFGALPAWERVLAHRRDNGQDCRNRDRPLHEGALDRSKRALGRNLNGIAH